MSLNTNVNIQCWNYYKESYFFVLYEGGNDFSGITVTLEKANGSETVKITAAKAAVSAGEGIGKIALAASDVMTTVTDENGFYEFTDVEPGEYTLTAQKNCQSPC